MFAAIKNRLSDLHAFPRGIHPPHRKYTQSDPIQVFSPENDLLIPLAQHIGAACEPLVKPKQEVTLGEVIADATAFVTAPIHAPAAGKIAAAAITPVPGGRRVPAIPIKLGGEEPSVPHGFLEQYLRTDFSGVEATKYEPDMIVDRIRAAGLVGLGGATFPTHVKLRRNPERPIDTLILNGAECEPYLTADHRLMVEAPGAIVVGLELAAHAVGAKRVLIAVENNKPDAIEALKKETKGRSNISVLTLAAQYPMGGERQLIYATTHRTVPAAPKGLPLDVGVVVVNVATAHTIAHAVVHERPLTHRVVTVTGHGVAKPGNYLAPVGTSMAELVEKAAGGTVQGAVKVIAGGPMMGQALPSLDMPVVKGTGGITIMLEEELVHWHEGTCIRCGQCVQICPSYLSPTKIAHAVKFREYETAAEYDMMGCIECGCCSYGCPARIPLAQYIKAGKNQLRAIAAQKKAQEESPSKSGGKAKA